jgi:hypothetical protein
VSTILPKPKVQSKHSTFRFTYLFHTVEQIQDLRGMPWNRIFEADTCKIVPETFPNLVLSKMSVMPLSQFVFGWSEVHNKTRNISRGPRSSWTGASRRCHGQGEKCSRDIQKNWVYTLRRMRTVTITSCTALLHRSPPRATAREADHRSAQLRKISS